MSPASKVSNSKPDAIVADRIVAHRGYPARFPDNSLAGIQAAIEAGAKYIEVDIQLTSDHVPVLFHDRDLQRVCGTGGSVHQFSLSELGSLNAAEAVKFGKQFAGTSITRLDELCELLSQHPDLTVFVEIKRISIKHFGADCVWQATLKQLSPISSQSIIISFNVEILALAQKAGWPVGVVLKQWPDRLKNSILELDPNYLFIDIDKLPQTGTSDCINAQLVAYDTVDPTIARDMIKRGISLVETFDICGMLTALRQK